MDEKKKIEEKKKIGELIVNVPREFFPTIELIAKKKGFNDSRELFANFVRKQLAMELGIEKDSYKLSDIK